MLYLKKDFAVYRKSNISTMKLFIVHSDIMLCRDFGPTYRDTSSLESSRIQLYHWGAVVPSSSLLYYVYVLLVFDYTVMTVVYIVYILSVGSVSLRGAAAGMVLLE